VLCECVLCCRCFRGMCCLHFCCWHWILATLPTHTQCKDPRAETSAGNYSENLKLVTST
jgi:hypothetical protein